MDMRLLDREIKGAIDFFVDYTNLDPNSPGFGLTADSTHDLNRASIAATGFCLSAWVIAVERGVMSKQRALEITRGTLRTLLHNVSQHRGFFAHFLHMDSAQRWGKSEYSTIDSALCLNGVITAASYFHDTEIRELADELLKRVDWNFIVFEDDGLALFHMAYNPDQDGDYVETKPGFISRWDMAAEQKMMYLQAAGQLDASLARRLYQGFRRDKGYFEGQEIIITPGGNLFAYQFSDAWLDTGRYLDPDGIDWFNNTRLATLANRDFCIKHADEFKTYHEDSWGISCGDGPWGYDVSGATPSIYPITPNGTISIHGALAALPFVPDLTMRMIDHVYRNHPQTWGKYGFFAAYNLAVDPPWYSHAMLGIDKGCAVVMIENYLTGLIWDVYSKSPHIQKALSVLNFTERPKAGS